MSGDVWAVGAGGGWRGAVDQGRRMGHEAIVEMCDELMSSTGSMGGSPGVCISMMGSSAPRLSTRLEPGT